MEQHNNKLKLVSSLSYTKVIGEIQSKGININLPDYIKGGKPEYKNLLSIERQYRIPELSKTSYKDVRNILAVVITSFVNSFNVKNNMNEKQVFDLAENIIETSNEDNLSIEDVIVFLKGAKMGRYGKVYDRLDEQVIFEMFERYRQERHEHILTLRNESHANNTAKQDYKHTGLNVLDEFIKKFKVD